MKTALQLYSLTTYIQAHGLENTLKLVSECGFNGVEFAGFYNYNPIQIKEMLNKYNLTAISAHISIDEILNNLHYIEFLNLKYVVIPYLGINDFINKFDDIVLKIINIKKVLDKKNIKLGYHNHSHEFENGNDFVSLLNSKIDNLLLEFDVCWLTVAKQNITETFSKYNNLIDIIHIKDFSSFEHVDKNTPIIGNGLVNMEEVFTNAKKYKTEWFVLEAENISINTKQYLIESLNKMKHLYTK